MTLSHPIANGTTALLFVVAFAVLSVGGCDTGYHVDTGSNSVNWVTWDEGRGRREWAVEGADARTFQELTLGDGKPFAKDKNHVYLRDTRIEGADPASFRKSGQWYRDDESVFVFVDRQLKQLAESDPDSFRRLDALFWSRDDTRVFFQDRGFVPNDISSFERLEGHWSRDAKSHYYKSRRIGQIDRESFAVYEHSKCFARDSHQVYWQGRVVDGADSETFVPTKYNEGHDQRTNFYFILKDERQYGIEYHDKETVEIITRKYTGPDSDKSP